MSSKERCFIVSNQLIYNIRKAIIPDMINAKSIVFILTFIVFPYQHVLLSVLSQTPFLFFSDVMFTKIGVISKPVVIFMLFALLLLSLIAMKNKRLMRFLAILNLCDHYATLLLALGRLGYLWKHYATLLDLLLKDTSNEKNSYYFNIIYLILSYIFNKDSVFLNQYKQAIGRTYFITTIIGQSIFMIYFLYCSGYIPNKRSEL
jgi:hypothetical protein